MRKLLVLTFLAGCGSANLQTTDGGGDASAAPDGGVADLSAPSPVTFSFHPDWGGVTAVSVVGGFGMAGDWKQPLVTLQPDGAGGFSGAAMLPSGEYLYLFEVTGDEAAATPASYKRYAVDPHIADFAACPMASPSFSMKQPNPCSRVTVPQLPPPSLHAVTGQVTVDGAPAAGWLTVFERDEKMSHHYFVDRATSKADGTFTVSLAPGTYRVQVLHPTFLSKTDAERAALLGTESRRVLSSTFVVSSSLQLSPAEVAYHDYDKLSPRDVDGGVPLPTTFSFTVVQGATKARLDIYGTGMAGKQPEIGDPWYATPLGTATSAPFDGGFNTMQAGEPQAVPGERYFWGTEQLNAVADGGTQWTRQSMVVPITFR